CAGDRARYHWPRGRQRRTLPRKDEEQGPLIASKSGMPESEQRKKAEKFLAMHAGREAVVLANVWDVASGRIIEDAGFPAIATTSAGIAFAQGFPDGQKIPADRMIAAVANIASRVRVPVTADVEAGYGQTPEDAGRTARQVIEAGAV